MPIKKPTDEEYNRQAIGEWLGIVGVFGLPVVIAAFGLYNSLTKPGMGDLAFPLAGGMLAFGSLLGGMLYPRIRAKVYFYCLAENASVPLCFKRWAINRYLRRWRMPPIPRQVVVCRLLALLAYPHEARGYLFFKSGRQEARDYYDQFLDSRRFRFRAEERKPFTADESTPDWYRPEGKKDLLASGEIVHNEEGEVYMTFYPLKEALDSSLPWAQLASS